MQTIQWFPGHMAKTRRIMRENLSQVDIVLELVDARIPESARNPEIAALTAGKPVLTLLNKSSLADPAVTKAWVAAYRARGEHALAIDCVTGEGIGQIGAMIRQILADKVKRYAERGMSGRKLRAMVVGIPNVGKSSLINRLCGGKKVKVEDRPGVTLTKQWVPTAIGLDLMDMPGVLWPKFDDPRTGEHLAMTGAIKDDILDTEQLAGLLCARLMEVAPEHFCARYKLDRAAASGKKAHELLEAVAKKRGFLLSGGVIDTERAAAIVLDEFRGGKIGRISLEAPASAEKKDSLTPDVENRDILADSVPAPAASSAEKLESASICTACEVGDSVNKNTDAYAMPDDGEGER